MKKYFLFFAFFLLLCLNGQAQYYQPYHVLILDQNLDTLYGGRIIVIQNTDSTGTSSDFAKYYGYPTGPDLTDSVLVPASYSGNQISFFYQDCNGYQRYDTTFTPGVQLNVVFHAHCSNPCNADFTQQHGMNRNVHFMATNHPGPYVHRWYFGDGNTANIYNPLHQYAVPGNYNVWHVVQNPNIGCYDSIMHTISVYDSCFADFTYTMDTLTTVTFTAIVFPTNSYVFWDFGDGNTSNQTNPIHTYPAKTNYNVKMSIYGAGCNDSAMKTIQVNGSFICNASVNTFITAPYEKLFVRTDSSAGYPEWKVGNTVMSQAHSYKHVSSGPGYEYVRLNIKDSLGNVACTDLFTVYFNTCGQPYPEVTVGGLITFDSVYRSDYDSLIVYLILHDTTAGTLTLVDSQYRYNHDSAYYWFSLCNPADQYLVKAALLPGSSLYADYLPTYHYSNMLWSGADPVHPGAGNFGVNINMIAGSNPGGPGFIGGYVSQGANKSGDVLDGIQVLLLTGTGDPVASVHTSNGGRYEFSNLALGTYQVLVEIPGKPSSVYTITLTQTQPSSDDNDFEVNKADISLVNSVITLPASIGKMFPNPVKETLFLEWTAEAEDQLTLTFLSVDGKVLASQTIVRNGDMHAALDVSGLPQGIVIMRIEGERTLSVQRLQKQ